MILSELKPIFQNVSDSLDLPMGLTFQISNRPDLSDFQSNDAMKLAPALKMKPVDLANKIIEEIKKHSEFSEVSVAGPGFINVKISDEFIQKALEKFIKNNKINFKKTDKPLTIDMDYGAYNVAKALHIGHLRTSIVGDTMNRISGFIGHKVISYNHIGDFGRPMGIVIAYIETIHPDWPYFKPDFNENMDTSDCIIRPEELDAFYPNGNVLAKENPEFMERARKITADFQSGHLAYNALYNKFLKISLAEMEKVLESLNLLDFTYWYGEKNASKYVPEVEKLLNKKHLLRKDDGAMIVEVATDEDTAPMPPLIFENSRSGQTYQASDLGAIYFRIKNDNPDFIWYFTDARQSLHFNQVFRVAEKIGLISTDKLKHCAFGSINGANGKPFATRDGNVPSLQGIIQMVDEAVQTRVDEAGKNLDKDTIHKIAVSALKFNDLIHEVKSNYIFDLDSLTSFEGRTGPYILYTSVRLNSILKRATNQPYQQNSDSWDGKISIYERDLMLTILNFQKTIYRAFDNIAPDVLANYIYDVATKINLFYHNSPVLRDDIPNNLFAFRLDLIQKSKIILDTAIGLLGIGIPDEM